MKLRRWNAALWAVVAAGTLAPGQAEASRPGSLAVRWTARPTGNPVAARPIVVNGTVFVGSWDGYEYAFDEASGRLRWRSFLGTTTGVCGGTRFTQGVTSSPAFWRGVGYLGGGDSNWDALDPRTGNVLWQRSMGDNSPSGGLYNWSSPLVYRGHGYMGVSSFCDSPLVQGKLVRLDLASHTIDRVWKAVPDRRVGGTIWTNPVVVPATNTVYVTTGTRSGPAERYAEAMVALDANTLAVKSYWSLPVHDEVVDSDWGTSPTLFSDARGRALVAAVNKNGILYAFRQRNLHAGPVWRTRLAQGGPCPDCGDGSVSTGFFDGRRLYFAGGRTTIRGRSYRGSIRALDPASGRVTWARGLPAPVLAALAGKNGLLVVAPSNGDLQVLRSDSGAVLYRNHLQGAKSAAIFGAPTIADGNLVIGTTNGVVHSFRFPHGPAAATRHGAVTKAPR
jgi:outer membrane protein assembly factor BamB